MTEVIRAFIAIPIEPALKQALREVQQTLQAECNTEAVRWTPPDQMHLTLKFLGHVERDRLANLRGAVTRACAGICEFGLSIEGLGCFPSIRRPSVVWAGVRGDMPVLQQLYEQIDRETSQFGSHAEERPFHPHLTIGRVKPRRGGMRGLGDVIHARLHLKLGEWTVRAVDLIQSLLSSQGSQYTGLHQATLGPPRSAASRD